MKIRYQLKNTPIENFISIFFLKWWCGPFALGLIFSPPLALSAKNGELESTNIFSQMVI
jgi:hypothetical protein